MVRNVEISILMPTYNDEEYIEESIESVLAQDFQNFELIIVNNGSTDNTDRIVKQYCGHTKVKCLAEKRLGQLNALYRVINMINGRFILLLHSDDLLVDGSLDICYKTLVSNPNIDGVYSDLIKIDETGKEKGLIHTSNVIDPKLLLLFAGSNIIPNIFFVKREWFYRGVLRNYLLWNMPYWFYIEDNGSLKVANLKKVRPFYKYRVYSGNYINSDVGKFVSINGRIRTILTLGRVFHLPCPKFQRLFEYVFSKSIPPFSIPPKQYPKNVIPFVEYAIKSTYGRSVPWYVSYVLEYLKNYDPNKTIEIRLPGDIEVYYGRDVRQFYYDLHNNLVPDIYLEIIEKANEGFGKVKTNNKLKMEIVLNFLNIPATII